MKLECGNCGMAKVELKKPTPRHSRVAFCTTCGKFTTYITFPGRSYHDGWMGNDTPPQWAKDAAKKLKRPAYSWA
jgi:hypothetical protein